MLKFIQLDLFVT